MDTLLKQQADELWQRGLAVQAGGDLDAAAALYQESIETCPTADAHTYLGWVYSLKGRLDEALEQCLTAIKVDPEFGNPYNDIGCYLMMKGFLDEAIPWLRKAMIAARYESRCLPFYNLGRIYEKKGMAREAIREYQRAVTEAPNFKDAYRAMKKLEAQLN